MPLEGTLNYLDVAHLVQVVGASQKSGVLEISWEDRSARLLFERGDLTCAESNVCHDGIGTLLVNAELLAAADLDLALVKQRGEGSAARRLGAILCDDFGVEPEDIERLLRQQFERVALDVFSWPGGKFVFRFREARSEGDRFHLDAIEFILAVGIRAGLLVEKAFELGPSPSRRPLLFFVDEDEALLERYREHWRRKGYAVTCCAGVPEVLSALATRDEGRPRVVIVSWGDNGCAASGPAALRALRERHPEVTAVVLAGGTQPALRLEARAAGAKVFVHVPAAVALAGPQGEVRFEVSMVSLERALALALATSSQEDGGPLP
jgi:CheY-like chemotaxis protein